MVVAYVLPALFSGAKMRCERVPVRPLESAAAKEFHGKSHMKRQHGTLEINKSLWNNLLLDSKGRDMARLPQDMSWGLGLV